MANIIYKFQQRIQSSCSLEYCRASENLVEENRYLVTVLRFQRPFKLLSNKPFSRTQTRMYNFLYILASALWLQSHLFLSEDTYRYLGADF